MAPKRNPPLVKPQPSERKQRKKRLPETSSDKDSEAEETAVVVAESEPEAEDKASDDQENKLAKQKRARLNTFNMYFNDLTEDIQQQWIETNKPGCLQKREKKAGTLRLCCSQNKSAADQPHRKDHHQEPFVPQSRNARGQESWCDNNRTASKTWRSSFLRGSRMWRRR